MISPPKRLICSRLPGAPRTTSGPSPGWGTISGSTTSTGVVVVGVGSLPARSPAPTRNAPCWCDSERKYKQMLRELLPVTELAQVALDGILASDAKIAALNEEGGGRIVTTIEPATDWYPAEDYHQDYWAKEGQSNPYCLAVIPPKLNKLRKSFQNRLKATASA